ncbi:hypothetical protein FA95DRAFT_1078445 [Auriscalpium vulgare]|uniref:Uncharacterized protein n=1 Tax=Auriscalpium vulgare TaxID=40419 RepID=A0ACB8R583_9AGAM|nr:hypothetical protein FA95DRAFT_1078445 [Auriscalpium vulgare]
MGDGAEYSLEITRLSPGNSKLAPQAFRAAVDFRVAHPRCCQHSIGNEIQMSRGRRRILLSCASEARRQQNSRPTARRSLRRARASWSVWLAGSYWLDAQDGRARQCMAD